MTDQTAGGTEHPDRSSPGEPRRPAASWWEIGLRLGGYAFLILFFELALIRYISAYVRVFGFYLNFVLIATFLGMGVGMLRADWAPKLKWAGPLLGVLLVAVVKYFSNVVVPVPEDRDEALWGVYFEIAPTVQRIGILPTVAALFSLCTAFFVPLGALMGEQFRRMLPLTAYSVDIAGSLAGIAVFGALSALGFPPVVWFSLGCAVWLVLSLRSRPYAALVAVTGVAMVIVVQRTAVPTGEHWSPYYRINVADRGPRHSVSVNGSFHQWILDFSPATLEAHAETERIKADYREPFKYFARPDTVLVVGAGTGNDVALLLELGVPYIDAVEIDPAIYALGQELNVHQPYADRRVHVHITDAREFLKRSGQKYDLIVFGTLDSQTLLSGMSSLRLDNYVYTVESFQEARARLKPSGNLVAYHMSPQRYIAAKIFSMLHVAFGEPPAMANHSDWRLFNYVFLAGPAAPIAQESWGDPDLLAMTTVTLPHDDWPYMYVRVPTIPMHYVKALAVVLAVAAVAVFGAGGTRVVRGFDWALFFMGMGFLLIETKSVAEMSLLFGATWQVNLLVFSSILIMVLAANHIVLRKPPKRLDALFLGLFASLALAALVPVRSLLFLGAVGQWIAGGLLVASPIFFAAMIFATMFRTRTDWTSALAANLIGAVLGGLLEYLSLAIGIKGLYLVAAVAYGAAFLFGRRSVASMPVGASSVPSGSLEAAAVNAK